MCFSAAVIIILGTQAQTNPLNRTLRERECERQCSSDGTYVCISTTVQFEGKEEERRDDTVGKRVRKTKKKKKTLARIPFYLQCLFIE